MTASNLHLIGVDGGGTSTRAVRATLNGHVLARATAGPSNPTSTSLEETAQSLRDVFRSLMESVPPGPVSVCLGLAGVGFSGKDVPVETLTRDMLTQDGWQPVGVSVITDAEAALEAATEGSAGSILIAGTGSVALGRSRQGQSRRVGGWGFMLGDEGSGAWLGRELLRSVAREADGREPDTGLGREVLLALGLSQARDLVTLVYGPPALRAVDFARYAKMALELAHDGHAGAYALVERAAAELCTHVATLWHELSLTPQEPLGLTGGVLHATSPLSDAVGRQVFRDLGVTARPVTLLPVVGALFAAARNVEGTKALRQLAESPEIRAVHFA